MEAEVLKTLIIEAIGQALEGYIEEKLSGQLSTDNASIMEGLNVINASINSLNVAVYTLVGVILAAIFVYIIISTINHRRF